MTDFIVIGVILCLIIGVSYYMWSSKKSGKSSGCCGSSCNSCGGSCSDKH